MTTKTILSQYQRELLNTARKQAGHAAHNVNEAICIAGLEDAQVDEAYQELHMAYLRLWNALDTLTIQDNGPFTVSPINKTRFSG